MKPLIAGIFCCFLIDSVMAQCDADKFSTNCISKLSHGFNFLKAYKIINDGDKDKIEYSYVFTKGTNYMITLCSQAQDRVIVTLLDSERNKVANSIDGQKTNGMIYPCNATGIYYICFTFGTPGALCGGSALGFKR